MTFEDEREEFMKDNTIMQIAICDDNVTTCTLVEGILLKCKKTMTLKLKIDVFYSAMSLLDHLNAGNAYDLIFLDIEMDSVNGIDAGKYIRSSLGDYSTEIAYVSGYNNYDRQLFAVQPLDFIPKPIKEDSIINVLNIALKRKGRFGNVFCYEKEGATFKIPAENILYFESKGRKVEIVATTGVDEFYGVLKSISERVSKEQFIQINRYMIINYQHAIKITSQEVTMSNGKVYPIGKGKKEELLSFMLENQERWL